MHSQWLFSFLSLWQSESSLVCWFSCFGLWVFWLALWELAFVTNTLVCWDSGSNTTTSVLIVKRQAMKVPTTHLQEEIPKERDKFCHSHGPRSVSEEKILTLFLWDSFFWGWYKISPFSWHHKIVSPRKMKREWLFNVKFRQSAASSQVFASKDLICWSEWIFPYRELSC